MKGKIISSSLNIGRGRSFRKFISGKVVEIVDSEIHPIWGKRYKINGYEEWFEENCFEYIDEEETTK